ncbi:hypothetical protein M434DRAFT_302809 [Hypoxylon sp. CO27-5]|nr:hypothetical protein M434DRAFT_302809 [Hypoxylon sp. CO27-5]
MLYEIPKTTALFRFSLYIQSGLVMGFLVSSIWIVPQNQRAGLQLGYVPMMKGYQHLGIRFRGRNVIDIPYSFFIFHFALKGSCSWVGTL